MAEHARFTAETGVPVFFCDPAQPLAAGSNENADGLVRQYLTGIGGGVALTP
jgi:transposase, IS30 family